MPDQERQAPNFGDSDSGTKVDDYGSNEAKGGFRGGEKGIRKAHGSSGTGLCKYPPNKGIEKVHPSWENQSRNSMYCL